MLKATTSIGAICAALLAAQAQAQEAAPTATNRDAQLPAAAEQPIATSQPAPATGAAPSTTPVEPGVSTTAAPDATPAQADDEAAARGVGDIVVTAQRRSENLQRVPISVTAVTSERLVSAGVVTLNQIQSVAPGVIVAQTFAGANVFVRGIGVVHTGFTSESPVAMYIDGIYIANAAASSFGFNNIERLEILKGPQGTLFGRNAVGGLVNVVTRDPSSTTSVEGSIGFGNYETYDASLYATTGLAPNLAMDVALLYHDQANGWGTNLATGNDVYKNRDFAVSSKLRWTPTDTTTISLRGMYDRQVGTIGVGTAVYPGSVGADGTRNEGKYKITSRLDPFNRSRQYNLGLKIEQDVGFATLVSLTGYTHLDSIFGANSPGILGTLVPGRGAVDLLNDGFSDTYTQELQLQSKSGSALQYILGAFYMHDRFRIISEATPTCINGVCNPFPVPVRAVGDQVLQSYAAFGEATLTLAETTRITAGVRYTEDRKDNSRAFREPIAGYSNSVTALPGPNRFGDVGGVAPKANFSKVTFRGVLAHDFAPRTMAYASFNRGFKAGAFNPTVFTNPVAQPEVLDAYEVGFKSQLFDNVLRLNGAAFYYEYSDIQLRTFAPPALPGQTILYNAAKAHLKGIDVEATFAPSPYLVVNAAASLLDAKFASFPGGTCTTPRPIGGTVLGGAVAAPCDLTGFRLPRAPKFSGSLGATYRIPSSVGEFTLNASDTYSSGYFWEADNRLKQDAYHQINLSVAWKAPSGTYNVQAYVHNVNEPDYLLRVTEAVAGTDSYSPGNPRTYGVRVGFKF